MDSGRLRSHHAPKDRRNNFKSTTISPEHGEKKSVPGYILDYEGPYVRVRTVLSKTYFNEACYFPCFDYFIQA